MTEDFVKVQGLVVQQIARDLFQRKIGERIKSISDYEILCGVSRGTIQNALSFLKESKALSLKSRGKLGSFIESIDYSVLQKYALAQVIIGSMTLPYSKKYEGLATGLAKAFKEVESHLSLVYSRGSHLRIQFVSQQTYDFAIVSRYAALEAIAKKEPLKIVMDFGPGTYLDQHVLLLADKAAKQIENGMRVAIDPTSMDHFHLTKVYVAQKEVELVQMNGNQILPALMAGEIDAGIWNYDEVSDKQNQDWHYVFLENSPEREAMSSAVIICHEKNQLIANLFEKNIQSQTIVAIQDKVVSGEMLPQY